MKKHLFFTLFAFLIAAHAQAFCGFYVAKADASLYNKASQVVMVRDQGKTVLSLLNDFQGNVKDFAMVIPVPEILEKEQINVGEKKLFERIDAYSAPRLVEYFDSDPCQVRYFKEAMATARADLGGAAAKGARKNLKHGVKIERQYTKGEYDILILSAKESSGLETWLSENGYKIPKGASKILRPYIKQKMNFFVAKVNLKEHAKKGQSFLSPLQFAFNSEKFMLPIRLGMLNAEGPQDLIVYALTRNGRVESKNYRTVKLPADLDLPVYIKEDFSNFYKSMFDQAVKKENMKAVFTEYFWNMSWCDPCAADPLTPEELKGLGVFWLNEKNVSKNPNQRRILPPGGGAQPVMLTRLHVRYTKETHPDDLFFQETKDTRNFQGRYVLRHDWSGDANQCEAARAYFKNLPIKHEKQAQNLARLTNWNIQEIRSKLKLPPKKDTQVPEEKDKPWWKNLWGSGN